jgi:hypothetical protein
MVDDRGYESTSLPIDLKDELRKRKGDNESYGDVIERALATETRLKQIRETQKQQARLQVRIAKKMDINDQQIPTGLAVFESHGDTDVSDMDDLAEALGEGFREQGSEEPLDLTEEERREKGEAIAKAADENEGLHGATKEQVEAAREELDEEDDDSDENGWTDSFEDSDNGDEN